MAGVKTVFRTARKEHRCDLCGETIKVGEKYKRETLFYKGKMYDFASHCDCDELCELLHMQEQAEEIDTGVDSEIFATLTWEKISEILPYEAVCRMSNREQVQYLLEHLKEKE